MILSLSESPLCVARVPYIYTMVGRAIKLGGSENERREKGSRVGAVVVCVYPYPASTAREPSSHLNFSSLFQVSSRIATWG